MKSKLVSAALVTFLSLGMFGFVASQPVLADPSSADPALDPAANVQNKAQAQDFYPDFGLFNIVDAE